MPNLCRVCTHPSLAAIDAAMSEPGVSDYEIARQFGLTQPSVCRHRRNHLFMPRVIAAIDARCNQQPQEPQQEEQQRGKQTQQDRQIQQVVDAYDAGDPHALALASLTLPVQAFKLNKLEEELEVASVRAMEAGSTVAISSLAGARIRVIEVRSKLGMLGGYKPPSAILPVGDNGPKWSIQMVFSGANKTETMTFADRPVLDGDLVDPAGAENAPPPPPKQKLQRDREGKSLGQHWSFEKLHDPPDEDDQQE
jgi:hypothetical protein